MFVTKVELLEKAKLLPMSPGVYQMKNSSGKVIYVGKAKYLRNRVSNYFMENGRHHGRTKRMVTQAVDFDIYYTKTEQEALILENQFIKQLLPKYNIKLKDGKDYPYVQMTFSNDYPEISVVYKRLDEKFKYFGPYTSAKTAYDIVRAAKKAFKLPTCKRAFPRDIGKYRPCINYEIGRCMGVCRKDGVDSEEYKAVYNDVARFLRGDSNILIDDYKIIMEKASEEMEFEKAAKYRDMIKALQRLTEQQHIVAPMGTMVDIIGLYTDDQGGAMTVLFIRNGAIMDRECFYFNADEIVDSSSLSSFLYRFYQLREFVPKEIYTNIDFLAEDRELLSEKLNEPSKVKIITCKKGDKKQLTDQAVNNAKELLLLRRETETKTDKMLISLANFLQLEVVPYKIEAYDVSNSGEEHITCGMVVMEKARFAKKKYRSFNIKTVEGQNDYGAMREGLSRRLNHTNGDWAYPDLILLDGGKQHVSVIKQLMQEMDVHIPVFGMVKDEHHKTRTLTDGQNEISLLKRQDLFEFFYKIQEETHRNAFEKMDVKRRKTVKTSSLYKIDGIGPKTAGVLLKHFGGINKIKAASLEELVVVKGISRTSAEKVYNYYKKEDKK
ncbi:excinuclease ABC subunit UvrC [Eubacteriales bacterium OttesenSCG-928-G02]|nr:excinuclease ABC subunit UvrC [Eubacteriales bacterium OttesenSCG-928-G02]